MGNPIVLQVSEKAITSTSGSPISFHQVHMQVDIACDGSPVASYTLSQPFAADTQQEFDFDIASCFRAAAAFYTIAPITNLADRAFPTYTARVSAYSSYMKDGARIETTHLYPGGSNESGSTVTGDTNAVITTRMGHYSDFERMQSAGSATLTATLTRKPTSSPELVFPGDTILYAHRPVDAQGVPTVPTTSAHRVPEASVDGASLSLDGHPYYITRRRHHSVMFQFLNSRGCIETIRAFAHHSEKANFSQTDHTISRFERFSQFSRNLLKKQLRPSEFALTSGAVDYEWARWWLYEFCQAEHVWMLVDEHNPLVPHSSFPTPLWLPVNIKPADSATLIDYTKTDMLSVDFTVLPDMNGPMF